MKFRILMFFMCFFSVGANAKTQTVDYVDVSRYLGTWYEISSIPQSFSKGCTCSRAQYSLRQDGQLAVFNSREKDGEQSSVLGRAKIVDSATNAKLKVTFFWPFYGDYWIIGLDRDYRYAVVSNKKGTSLWVLSRTPELRADLYREAIEIAKMNKIDIAKLQRTSQRACSYPESAN